MKDKLTELLMYILFFAFAYYALLAASEDADYAGQFASWSNGELVEVFDTYGECEYISDGHGNCSPITED